jgi:hypothetical protein
MEQVPRRVDIAGEILVGSEPAQDVVQRGAVAGRRRANDRDP